MDKENLLEIPEFLRRKPKDIKRDIQPEKVTWWMPDLQAYRDEAIAKEKRKEEIQEEKSLRLARKARKKRIESNVLDAVGKNHITFGQIRAYIYDGTSDSEIKGAIRRLMKDGKLSKPSRRTYKVKL